jgi:dihydrofolate synthase/folylpolyglutamate synthase
MPTSTKTRAKPARAGVSRSSASVAAKGRKIVKVANPASERADSAGAITNYTTALRWLHNHTDHEKQRIVRYNEKTFNLDRMRKLLALLGNPHDQLKCVQVAGTKGKGSTCAMLASMLQHSGYTVGLYTSPHLVDIRERITIDGMLISYNDFAEVMKLIASKVRNLKNDPPTFFEILTVAALRYFADQAVDIVVLECGLGGRLDATTAVDPLVVGLTQISLDHTNILGKDLASIAREKAGTFKKGVPAISVEQEPGVVRVFDSVASESGTPLEFTGKAIDFSFRFEVNRELGPHTRVCLTTTTSRFEHLAVPLRGEHQAHNCGLALAILDKLKAHGFVFPEDKVVQGLAATRLDGRMHQVWSEPRIIADGAHNGASIQALIRALGAHIAYDSLVLIFGCAQDKDINGMLKQIALGADKVIFTKAKTNPRACEPEDLMHRFNELSGKMAQCAPSLEEALRLAGRAVSREDLIVITGSFYLAGEAIKHFADVQIKRDKLRR